MVALDKKARRISIRIIFAIFFLIDIFINMYGIRILYQIFQYRGILYYAYIIPSMYRLVFLIICLLASRDSKIKQWLRAPVIGYAILLLASIARELLRQGYGNSLVLNIGLLIGEMIVPAIAGLRSPNRVMATPWYIYCGMAILSAVYSLWIPYFYMNTGDMGFVRFNSTLIMTVVSIAGGWAIFRALPSSQMRQGVE